MLYQHIWTISEVVIDTIRWLATIIPNDPVYQPIVIGISSLVILSLLIGLYRLIRWFTHYLLMLLGTVGALSLMYRYHQLIIDYLVSLHHHWVSMIGSVEMVSIYIVLAVISIGASWFYHRWSDQQSSIDHFLEIKYPGYDSETMIQQMAIDLMKSEATVEQLQLQLHRLRHDPNSVVYSIERELDQARERIQILESSIE